ncbi:MAG: TRAP transporter large permease subunit, partial [Pseudomonadota bacterium]
ATDVSISKLFIAGVLPGIMLALLFMGYVGAWSLLHPDQIPPNDIRMTFAEKVRNSAALIPSILLIAAVLGSIYGGIATATEAAAIGVLAALILARVQGGLNWTRFWDSVMGAVRTTSMIMLILAGSAFLSLAMGFTGLPRALAQAVGSMGLSQVELLVALTILYIILGCFLDGISMVVLTMAVLLPVIQQAQFDLLWFGIYVVLVVEMAQVTPPVGFNLFVLQGLTRRSIGYVSRVAFPFFLLMVAAVALITVFPEIVSALPNHMKMAR